MFEMMIAFVSLGVVYKLFSKRVRTYNKYTQTDIDLYIHQILTRISPPESVSPMHSNAFDFSIDDDMSVCSCSSLELPITITVMEE